MMIQVTEPKDIQKRIEKFKRRASGIRSEEHLRAVLMSFPEAIRLDVYNTVSDLLGSDIEFPIELPSEVKTVAEYIADLSKPVIKPSPPVEKPPDEEPLPDVPSDVKL